MFKISISDNERISKQFSNHNLETQIKAQILFKLYIFGILLLCILASTYISISPERLVFVLKEISPIMIILIISILPLLFGYYDTAIIITMVLGLLSNFIRNFSPNLLDLFALPLTDNTARLMLLILFIMLFSNNHRFIFFAFISSVCLVVCYSKLQYQTFWNTDLKICLILLSGSFLIGFLTRATHSITIDKLDKSQDALKQSEVKFRNLVESSSDWVWEVNTDNAYTYTSPIVQEVLGYMPDEIIGKTIFNFMPPEQASQIATILKGKLSKSLPIKALESISLHKNGRQIIIETSGVPVFNSKGKFTGYRGINRDITERKKAQKEIKAAKIRAEAALRAKSDFLSNMSHETRTPMNSILGFINLVLKDKKLSKLQLNYLTTAKSAAKNLLGLLDKILDINKLDSGTLTLEYSPFSLSRLILEIQSAIDAKAHKKGLHLSYEIQPSLSDSFIGDPIRLKQLLISLTDNAIKFTQKGSISVQVMSAKKENQIHCSITDTGIGIPANQLNKIFDPFTQLDSSITRKFGGIGMGLTTAKNLVEMMEGRIWVQSKENQGSIFHFIIDLPQTDQLPENKNFNSLIPQPAFSANRKGFKILIVEDNKINAILNEIHLKEQGHEIKVARNGQEAVKAVLREKLDIILMDIHMPKMNGIEATKQIRELETHTDRHLPIIAVTADKTKKTTEKYLKAGMDAVLSKPVNFNTLFEVIESLVPEGVGKMTPKRDPKVSGKTSIEKHESKLHVKELDRARLKILFKDMLLAFNQFNPYILKPFVAELEQYVSQNQLDSLIGHLKHFDLQEAKKETVKLMKKLKIDHGG